jgi:hypothetical protein
MQNAEIRFLKKERHFTAASPPLPGSPNLRITSGIVCREIYHLVILLAVIPAGSNLEHYLSWLCSGTSFRTE